MNYIDGCVSIIVPVYNVEKYLNRCVDSILSQTYRNIEIILVDDGSPDSCPAICDEYATADKRIKVIHKNNGGLASARNAGLDQSTGQYILFVDSDDWIDPDGVKKLVYIAEKYLVDFVRFRAVKNGFPSIADNTPVWLGKPREMSGGLYTKQRIETDILPRLITTPELTMGPIVSAWGSLFRRDFLDNTKIRFDESIRFSEDLLFSAEVVLNANSFYYLEEGGIYHYFYNSASISRSFRSDRWNSCKQMIHKSETIFKDTSIYDFSNQIERLKWFCVLLALNERRYLDMTRSKIDYCKNILNDPTIRELKLWKCGFNISIKQRLLFLLIKARATQIIARI